MQGRRIISRGRTSPFTKTLTLPNKAIALVIGKGGKTINGFRKTPGISSVENSAEHIHICGYSEEAVQRVASAIEELVKLADRQYSGYYPEFFAFCFCKSLQKPLLSVERFRFEKFSGESSDSDDFAGKTYFCFRSGESPCGSMILPTESSKINAENLAVGFGRLAVDNLFFAHWDISGYGGVLLSCFQRLLSQLEQTAREIKLIVRFGKDLFAGSDCNELKEGSFMSVSDVQGLLRRRRLQRRFSTACSEAALKDLKLQLERLQYVKVSSRKKISIHVADLDDRQRQSFNVSVRCQNEEDLLQNAESRRIFGATDYFQVLGVDRKSSEAEIEEAYRRCLIKLQYCVVNWVLSEKAIRTVEVSYQCLMDPKKRDRYLKDYSPSETIIPESCLTNNEGQEKAVIKRVRRLCNRHAFVSFCREGQLTSDFRVGVTSHESNMDVDAFPGMVEWVEEAWKNRTCDQLLVFDPRGRFRVLCIRYKETETYVTEDWKLRIAKVGWDLGGASNEMKHRWECGLSSRWFKWNDGIKADMKSVDKLVKEAAKLSQAMDGNSMVSGLS